MNACGLIVEYNPFHNGHLYHLREAKKASGADCMIAVMSGSFLQRGEPAIIDKFYRTRAALQTGVDLVAELPYPYAVQSSDLFAKGAVHTLNELGTASICFGSESGDITHFITGYQTFKAKELDYKKILHTELKKGLAFPEASRHAYQKIGLDASLGIDLTKPNNILGYSYVRTILEDHLPIEPLTIKRTRSGYHDQTITSAIASATSIRKEIAAAGEITGKAQKAIPDETFQQLLAYKELASSWHMWENYFPLLHYRVMTMEANELASIHGVDEGLEHRIKHTAKIAESFQNWVEAIKTKRYTWTRIQRMFVHILTNTSKTAVRQATASRSVPYVRILGMTETGQNYLNQVKKQLNVPLLSQLTRSIHPVLALEEKASHAYYSILSSSERVQLHNQELSPPVMV
ncbi:nucleotidyltransferase [Lentibacillus sediminis]|uniref:nucleotidyltransferase n=1 Tax=Lentibacillus sediminis TaxID=1940529 RepID=UPI000C1BB248|nr:nucleotidyltransferase [Lentibacillus sediminis]